MEASTSFRNVLLACINNELVDKKFAPLMEYQAGITAEDSRIINTALRLCKQFQDHDPQGFQKILSLCHDLHITKENIFHISSSLCEGVMHWGKVVAILVFAGIMSVEYYGRSDANMIYCIVEWTCEFVCRFVQEWMNKNGGWLGFVEHFTSKDSLNWRSLYDTVKDVVIGKLALKSF